MTLLGSTKLAATVHDIQTLVYVHTLKINQIYSNKWLSYFNALTAVVRTIDSLMTYLVEVGVKLIEKENSNRSVHVYNIHDGGHNGPNN